MPSTEAVRELGYRNGLGWGVVSRFDFVDSPELYCRRSTQGRNTAKERTMDVAAAVIASIIQVLQLIQLILNLLGLIF